MVTAEAIQERMAELRAQAEKLQADLNAVGGALQDCAYWLGRIAENTDPPRSE